MTWDGNSPGKIRVWPSATVTRVQSSGGLRRCSMSIISSWLIWLGISIFSSHPHSATIRYFHTCTTESCFHSSYSQFVVWDSSRKHILRSWVNLSTSPTGCSTCATKHYTKPAARKHMACHIQGIRVAAPSSGQGTSRGTNYGLISSGHIFQIFQKYLADCFNTSILK